jgi:hypothetical protein
MTADLDRLQFGRLRLGSGRCWQVQVRRNTADVAARARALRRVAENSTLAQQEFNKAFVLMQYFGYLRRNPNDPTRPKRCSTFRVTTSG